MNITADPGLPYTISHTYFTINITKINPSIWTRNPSILNLNIKDDKYIIFVLNPLKIHYFELYLQSWKLLELHIYKLLFCHHHIYITPSHQFHHKIDNLEPIHCNQLPVKELHPQLKSCLTVPQYICPENVSLDENRVNINLSLFHNFYL